MLKRNSNHLKNIEEGFQFVCKLDELKDKVGRRFIVDEVEIAIFKIESEVFAVSNICPHQQTHLIYDGFIEDEFVTCPAHGWKFNLRTGKKDSGSIGLDSYLVQIYEDRVFIKVYPKKYGW
ncbi:MAG: nitrite reductase (NAD(P)H) small subunit [Ignavibacteriaceae bacterium]|nr:nitrite reductase (NAD(P)H) small subunit [Ignavibacteriaceae bacterium]